MAYELRLVASLPPAPAARGIRGIRTAPVVVPPIQSSAVPKWADPSVSGGNRCQNSAAILNSDRRANGFHVAGLML